jgi:hypothetical protein
MMEEDLDAFLSATEHAVTALYDKAGARTTVNVIFDREHLLAHEMVSVANPVATGKASDFPEAAVGRTLEIADTVYTIRDRRPIDDGAFVSLQLEAA